MDVLVSIDMAGCATEITLESIKLAIQLRIDFTLIQQILRVLAASVQLLKT